MRPQSLIVSVFIVQCYDRYLKRRLPSFFAGDQIFFWHQSGRRQGTQGPSSPRAVSFRLLAGVYMQRDGAADWAGGIQNIYFRSPPPRYLVQVPRPPCPVGVSLHTKDPARGVLSALNLLLLLLKGVRLDHAGEAQPSHPPCKNAVRGGQAVYLGGTRPERPAWQVFVLLLLAHGSDLLVNLHPVCCTVMYCIEKPEIVRAFPIVPKLSACLLSFPVLLL